MMVTYKHNKHPATYVEGTSFIAKPLDGSVLPQGPFDKCAGCPYPRHGFLCWGRDGSCLRDDMEKIGVKKQ